MQQLRNLYKQAQGLAEQKPTKLTIDRCRKMLELTEKQERQMADLNDYSSFDELAFYHDRLQKIIMLLDNKQKNNKESLQSKIKAIIRQNPPLPTGISSPTPHSQIGQKVAYNSNQSKNQKDELNAFFNSRTEQIQRSKVGFKSVIEDLQRVPVRYKVKVTPPVNHPLPQASQAQANRLKAELERLKKSLNKLVGEKQFNVGILEAERCHYIQQIKDLQAQIAAMQQQNTILKQNSCRYPKVVTYNQKEIFDNHSHVAREMDFNPYNIEYLHNDISKIRTEPARTRIQIIPVKTYHELEHTLPTQAKYQIPKIFTIKEPLAETQKVSQAQIQKLSRHITNKQIINPNTEIHEQVSEIVRPSIKLNGSEIQDKHKNIAIRSKISFFKESMMLYRSSSFDIAVRSADIVKLQTKNIKIFFNNRGKTVKYPNFEYKCNSEYYKVVMKKKVGRVDSGQQSFEEVEVTLLNNHDLDSLIEVRLTVEQRQLHFLLPVMFIQFVQKRQFEDETQYRKIQLNPIHQASTLELAEEFLPLERNTDQTAGRVFGISKNHEGYIYFRWNSRGLQIETIQPWKLFIAYLLLRDC